MGMQFNSMFKTAALALTIAGLAACSSTSDTEEMPMETNDTAAADAAAAAARAEQQRLERERMARREGLK